MLATKYNILHSYSLISIMTVSMNQINKTNSSDKNLKLKID